MKCSEMEKVPLEELQFTYGGRAISPNDTVRSLRLRDGNEILVKGKVLIIKVKDEDGTITRYSMGRDMEMRKVMDSHVKKRRTNLEQMSFTSHESEILPDDTPTSLGTKYCGMICVVKRKRGGKHLTAGSINRIYGMSSSADKPYFKPHIQITDLVEAKHRNHWKVRATISRLALPDQSALVMLTVILLVHCVRW